MTDQTICHRCGKLLHRGRAELYVVQIKAHADPAIADLPELSPEQIAREIERLIDEAATQSERELREQVHAELEIILCNPCYRVWLDNPTG